MNHRLPWSDDVKGLGVCGEKKSHFSPTLSTLSVKLSQGTQSSLLHSNLSFSYINHVFASDNIHFNDLLLFVFVPFNTFINSALLHIDKVSHDYCSPAFSDVLRNIMSAGILWFYKKKRARMKMVPHYWALWQKLSESSWIIKQGQYFDQGLKEKTVFLSLSRTQ